MQVTVTEGVTDRVSVPVPVTLLDILGDCVGVCELDCDVLDE